MSYLLHIYLKRSKLYYSTVIIFFMFLSYCFKCIYNLIIHSTEEICSALAPAPDINLASTNLEFKKSFVWGLQSVKFFSICFTFLGGAAFKYLLRLHIKNSGSKATPVPTPAPQTAFWTSFLWTPYTKFMKCKIGIL